ncbi:hypothetical protein JB92DRAFT_2898076 [Gautieria morchelliformis]|nr:hypothetical protein JB92DRAFT_2898076 [Gautieria morchelliformis]
MIDRPTSLPFSSLPKLRDLRVSSVQPRDIPLLLRCTLLRRLFIGPGKLNELTLTDCWSILSNCPEMEVFHLTSVKSDVTLPPMGKITLSRLQDLRMGPFIPDPAPLIHCLETPVLQRLQLTVDQRLVVDSSCVRRLVQECRPPLTTLLLGNVDGADVTTCLPLLPDLASLTLHQSSAIDLVIDGLTRQDADGRFNCPVLEHLGLQLCLFKGEGLVRLARERRRAAGGLKVLDDAKMRYKPGEFAGLTIELWLVGEFSDSELKELYDMQTGT